MVRDKPANGLMRILAMACCALAGGLAPAAADSKPTYDKRIEEAAIQMLIPKLGDMRGTLDLGVDEKILPLANLTVIEKPVVRAPAPESAAAVETPRPRPKSETETETAPLPQARPVARVQAPVEQQQVSDNGGPDQPAPARGRRSVGSFLYF